MSTWTPDRVRDELPPIRFRWIGEKETHPAQITGRNNHFATVYVHFGSPDDRPMQTVSFEYAWSTIATALNDERPLKG